MPRTREYNESKVRKGLTATFLEKGYSNASLVDLETGSGLNRRQLYNDYGDKKDLLILALQDFSQMAGEEILSRLEQSTDGVIAIRATLQSMVKMASTKRGRLGCLICNTSREAIATDTDVKSIVQKFFARIEHAYLHTINTAIAKGQLSEKTNTKSLARFFFSIHVSLCVLSRAGVGTSVLRDTVSEALKLIE